jgi:uncharacterized protein YtpQ (UPF0354 family)
VRHANGDALGVNSVARMPLAFMFMICSPRQEGEQRILSVAFGGARCMRHVLGLLICVVMFCGGVRAQTLNSQAFTEEFARALTAASPSATVTVKGDLALSVKETSGLERTILLTNAYREYSLDPKRLNDIVKRFAAAMSQSGSASAKLDRSRIVPVIKDRQWLVELHDMFKKQGKPQEHLSESFNDELVIVYAEDDPTRVRYLTMSEDIGVGRQELRALAVENLKRILPKIEMRGDRALLVSAGGDYEPSLLLIDEIWSGGQVKVNGDIVVAVPARDVLLVTGSRDRTGLKQVRELATKFAAQGPYGLTDTLFVYRNGRFTKFGR